jgi:hypothetical protein
MKCIVDRRDLQTYRTTDREAQEKVKSGRFGYAKKHVWKWQGRTR